MSSNPFSNPQPNPFNTGLTLTFLNPATNKPIQCSPSSPGQSNNPFITNPAYFSSNAPFMSTYTPSPAHNTQLLFLNPTNISQDFPTSFMGPSSIECFEQERLFHEQFIKSLSEDKQQSGIVLNNVRPGLNKVKNDVGERNIHLKLLKNQLAAIEQEKSLVAKEINESKQEIQSEILRIDASKPKEELKYSGPHFKPIAFCDSEDWLVNQVRLRESQLAELRSTQEAEIRVKERKYKNELKRLEKEQSRLVNNLKSRKNQLNSHKQNVAFQKILRTEKPKLNLPPITFPVIQAELPPLPTTKPTSPYLYPILALLLSIYFTLSYN